MKICKTCQKEVTRPRKLSDKQWLSQSFCSDSCRIEATKGLKSSNLALWNRWQHMKQRCSNPKNPGYRHYGGRGISYDPKWESFSAFFDDMSGDFKEHLTLERINVNGNYNKKNCTWITKGEQSCNTRKTIYIDYAGQSYKLFELAQIVGVKYNTLYNRIYTYKMPIEIAVKKEKMGGQRIMKKFIANLLK